MNHFVHLADKSIQKTSISTLSIDVKCSMSKYIAYIVDKKSVIYHENCSKVKPKNESPMIGPPLIMGMKKEK